MFSQAVDVLLGDSSSGVVGAAAVAFNSVCPNGLALIAKHFRRLCETLPDIEEWYQITLIEILLRYVIARHGLVKESILFASNLSLDIQGGKDSVPADSISWTQAETIGNGVCGTMSSMTLLRHYIEEYSGCVDGDGDKFSFPSVTTSTNDDVAILLKCTLPLLWSQNSGVILAAASVHWIMAPVQELNTIVGPILFTLRSSPDATYVVLSPCFVSQISTKNMYGIVCMANHV
jgi:AP-3 complex subunit beta